jgi:hypothetical protein
MKTIIIVRDVNANKAEIPRIRVFRFGNDKRKVQARMETGM